MQPVNRQMQVSFLAVVLFSGMACLFSCSRLPLRRIGRAVGQCVVVCFSGLDRPVGLYFVGLWCVCVCGLARHETYPSAGKGGALMESAFSGSWRSWRGECAG